MSGPGYIEYTLCISNQGEEDVFVSYGVCAGKLEPEAAPAEEFSAQHARFAAKRLRWLADRLEDSASFLESKGGN